ncbi:MAG: 16S rRNA (cytosine(1402)-N(4))-methyltransferase RsmH [Phycisphaerales bacterium]
MTSPREHTPVLLDETLSVLSPAPGETYVDCTAGLGGHALAVGERLGSDGRVVLGDLDPANLEAAEARVRASGVGRVVTMRGSFVDLPRRLEEGGIGADSVLADLGFASPQVDDPGRGLSFRAEGPLDMRLDPSGPVTAGELVNTLPEGELAELIWRWGEERHSRRIARKVVAARADAPIETTIRLAEIVRSACPRPPRGVRPRIDAATRTFQALRIAVNDEIGSLEALLASVARAGEGVAQGRRAWLNPGARVAIITFHSLEDRPVKRAFAALVERGLAQAITRKPITPGDAECESNPRARSAKLRAIRIGGGQ